MASKLKTVLLASLTIFIAFAIIQYPDQTLKASMRGLNMWWEIVFPSLLPFFVTAELLIGFGVVRFIGVLFEPIMKPLFNVPGVGSFVWAMGMASGYPSGAKLTARLRQENQLSKTEAERLVSFTNASNPLFIFGAVSVGFFHDPNLGLLLAACHYGGNTLVGICMRFYRRSDKERTTHTTAKFSIVQAFHAMHQTRLNENRPFGKIFGDAVIQSIQTLLMIGGFIVMFSVFTKLIYLVGISKFLANGVSGFFSVLGLPEVLALPFISGLFEITLGAQMISQANLNNLLPQVIIVSFILAFNGFSVQAQVASLLAETDISFRPYFFARVLHGIFASVLALLLFKPLYVNKEAFEFYDSPVFAPVNPEFWPALLPYFPTWGPVITIVSLGVAASVLAVRLKADKQP